MPEHEKKIPDLECLSRVFIAKISSETRNGRCVHLSGEDSSGREPGLCNRNWFDGAYNASLIRSKDSGLTDDGKNELAALCCKFQLDNLDNPDAFDNWIKKEITKIGDLATRHRCKAWSVGRSQKIINIFLKYCCAAYHSNYSEFSDFHKRHSGIEQLTEFLHAPIDSNTIKHLKWRPHGKSFCWTKDIKDWKSYNDIQEELRHRLPKGISSIQYEMTYIW